MKTQSRINRFGSSAMISSLVMASLLTACSGGKTTPTGTTAADDKQGPPTEISIITEFNTVEPPGANNPVLKEIEKRTNTKLNITWVSQNNWTEKQNVVLASGDIPDLMKVADLRNPLMQQMVKQGAFWDLTPFIKDYPHLMEFPQSTWDNTKINGKNYVLPSVRPLDASSVIGIRKDWLDKLNLKMPQTTDELYEVMKAFVNNDPDGNGKKDTYGYNMRDMDPVFTNVFNKSTGKWKLVNGKLVDTVLEPGTRNLLVWFNNAYKEGLIPQDYMVMKTSQLEELATSNRAGLTTDGMLGLWRQIENPMKTDPKADFMAMTSLDGFSPQSAGFLGVYLIPKKVPEAKVKKILALMDFGATEEGFNLAINGIKDVHYKEVDGFKVGTKQADTDSISVSSFGKIFERYDKYLYAYAPGMSREVFERNKKIIDEKAKISTPDVSIGLVSATETRVGTEYKKKIDDLKTKVIMGKEPLEAWDAYVAKLKEDTEYQKIITEMNEAYQERVKSAAKK
ncbi:extracellular solute-binding protein [Paenibacillus periandrae]|uniref:extracellular solute-binding protein n=1 Tax=Paenibacillus periandrae TaxID=1761741 RepID=UPI001F098FF2|nr:extracellular solute-binding protein [Paenibacillus periandrae]